LDADNNVLSEEVSGAENDNANNSANNSPKPMRLKLGSANNNSEEDVATEEETTTTTTPMSTNYTIPAATRASNKKDNEQCNVVGLNSEFRKYGIYGLE